MKFKDYEIKYCGQCECPYIVCSICNFGSCTGGGCTVCDRDYKDFFQFEKDNQKILDDLFEKDAKQAKINKENKNSEYR